MREVSWRERCGMLIKIGKVMVWMCLCERLSPVVM